MDIINYTIYNGIDNAILKMMKSHLVNNDIDEIYKEWNFWDDSVERFKKNKQSRFIFEILFIGSILTAVAQIQSYDTIERYLKGYRSESTCALLSFVLQNIKWGVLESKGKRIFEGLCFQKQKKDKREKKEQKRTKSKFFLKKFKKKLWMNIPLSKKSFIRSIKIILLQ